MNYSGTKVYRQSDSTIKRKNLLLFRISTGILRDYWVIAREYRVQADYGLVEIRQNDFYFGYTIAHMAL